MSTCMPRHQLMSQVLELMVPILASIARFKETASTAEAGEKSIEALCYRG